MYNSGKYKSGGQGMSHVNLTQIIEKMKLENLTPEIDVKGIKITQPEDVYKRQRKCRAPASHSASG